MAMTAESKAQILKDYQLQADDTGSPEVQVALISARIDDLSKHFEDHPHDHHSRMGLLRIINQRRKLLSYLKDNDVNRYRSLIERLGLRK